VLKLHESNNYNSSDDDLLNSDSDKEESTSKQVDNNEDEIITQREDKDIDEDKDNEIDISTQIEENIEEEEDEEPQNPWTENEDIILKAQFDIFKSSHNVYEILVEEFLDTDYEVTRSSKEIAKRCKDLDLDVSMVPEKLPSPVKIIKKKAPRKSTKKNNNSINSEINKIQLDDELTKPDTLDDILNMEIDNTVPSKFDAPEESDDDDANNKKRTTKSILAKSGSKQHKISRNKKVSSPLSENLNQSKEGNDGSDEDMFNDDIDNNDNIKKPKNIRSAVIESDDDE
jgi:hypothetical protein